MFAYLNDIGLDCRLLGHKVHAALALLFLQLQRDAPNRAPLDPLHQMLEKKSTAISSHTTRNEERVLRTDLGTGLQIKVNFLFTTAAELMAKPSATLDDSSNRTVLAFQLRRGD
jgi:hypothetical protein